MANGRSKTRKGDSGRDAGGVHSLAMVRAGLPGLRSFTGNPGHRFRQRQASAVGTL